MAWSNQGGGGGGWQGGGGRGPWGQGPRGNGGGGGFGGKGPESLEDLIRKGQDFGKRMIPPGGSVSGRLVLIGLLIIAGIWLASGIYRVNADEQGVVLRFGKFVGTTQPGLRYRLPWPIEAHQTPQVTRVNREEVGFRSAGADFSRIQSSAAVGDIRDVPAESLMLTGDQNIVDIDFAVLWVIKDAGQFLFNVENPAQTIKVAAESAMREVIGKNSIQRILTEGRGPIEVSTRTLLQQILDSYNAGIAINQITLAKVDPPSQVIDAFRDVQAARADRERLQNEAEAYRNDVVPRARGEAQRILQAAEGYKQEVVSNAQGEAARFTSVVDEYRQAKEVTMRRLYLETMEQVLRGTNKVIIDQKGGAPGVQPYLPLPELQRARPVQPAQGAAR